ncbi:MAG: carbon-nitrogen hydrolase family protein [Bacillota bacterium]
MSCFLAAAVQMDSREDKEENLKEAAGLIDEAVSKGAKLIVLPELFNYLGPGMADWEHAEAIPGPSTEVIAGKAKQHGVYIVGGSILERVEDSKKTYNTSAVFAPSGEIIALYRKIHLYDVDVEDGPKSLESKYRLPGRETVCTSTSLCTLGLSICYDLRFPELYRSLSAKGAQVITASAYFARGTGKDHWELLVRARALENQAYMIAANQIGLKKPFEAHGHSMIVDPWGRIIAENKQGVGITLAEIDLNYLIKVRTELPALKHRSM